MSAARWSIAQIFLVPVLNFAVIAFGLVSALLGDGIWDQALLDRTCRAACRHRFLHIPAFRASFVE
ncbi:hypothetical protein ACVIHI_005563 [Bradyrhizobium sp. USDA 4524]|uniref:hypothetical protein n=1 Tax=Bradyrhizobium TaxID=374 RepID=UPI00209ED307|nr:MULTISPECIES: hypothetical protein [Bradyrhizobium]MCP1841515.1 hypothetical protein [Bradyrhizobium sp. USDA 4538]MCP1902079.1 hypothetical protein [Bradyrhizobium sp. USDA 4537]MCP1992264.1 hypothetical protein [Bradyrhizobium sp. USDA 4539]MCP3416205.1 hypothetical protein [Bradyrhizobium brasilense]